VGKTVCGSLWQLDAFLVWRVFKPILTNTFSYIPSWMLYLAMPVHFRTHGENLFSSYGLGFQIVKQKCRRIRKL